MINSYLFHHSLDKGNYGMRWEEAHKHEKSSQYIFYYKHVRYTTNHKYSTENT